MQRSPSQAFEASTHEDLSRILDRCDPDAATGCLLWTGAVKENGYALAKVQGIMVLAHRLVAFRWWGDIEGWDVHHTCGQRHCLNREHLIPLTPGDHLRAHRTGRLLAA